MVQILWYKLGLVITNFAVLSYLLFLMIHHYTAAYDTQSWAFIFHILSFSWLLIRGSFWASTLTTVLRWNALNFYLLYWMPTPLEFASFMVLPLYFTQILYTEEWKKYWKFVRPIYFSIIIAIIVFQMLWSWLAAAPTVSVSLSY